MNGVPSPFKPGLAVRSPEEYQGTSKVNMTPDCAVPDCKDKPVLVVNFGAFRMALCTQHGEDLADELHSRLRVVADENAPPLCSICRTRHGNEIVHACE